MWGPNFNVVGTLFIQYRPDKDGAILFTCVYDAGKDGTEAESNGSAVQSMNEPFLMT